MTLGRKDIKEKIVDGTQKIQEALLLLILENDDLRQKLDQEVAERKQEAGELRKLVEKDTENLKERLDKEIADRKESMSNRNLKEDHESPSKSCSFVKKSTPSSSAAGDSLDNVLRVGKAKLITEDQAPAKPVPTMETKSETPKKSAPVQVQYAPTPKPGVSDLTSKPVNIKSPEKSTNAPPAAAASKIDSSVLKSVDGSSTATEMKTAEAPALKKSTSSSSPPSMYQEAHLSPKFPPQFDKKVNEIMPVEEIMNPNNFVVRFADKEDGCVNILSLLNENVPAPAPDNWKIGRKEIVAVYSEDIWFRGMAVKKVPKSSDFVCFLLDFGSLVTVSQNNMRPLPEAYLDIQPYAYQVCLAGFGPREGQTKFTEEEIACFKDVLTADPSYKLVAEFLGQGEGGRWLINIRGKEDQEDIGKLLIDGDLGSGRSDQIVQTFEEYFDAQNNNTVANVPVPKPVPQPVPTPNPAAYKPTEVQAVKAPQVITGPKIQRGSIEVGSDNNVGGVCFFNSPDVFYICTSDKIPLFEDILLKSQEASPGTVDPAIGTCVLGNDDDSCWYRGEIIKLSGDKRVATLFLIDYGKELTSDVANLRPLPQELHAHPGLVVKVHLRGIKPTTRDTWSDAERDGAILVLDVGGQTMFELSNVTHEAEAGMFHVDMIDSEGNDVANFMIQTGCAAAVEVDLAGIKLDKALLPMGKVDGLVLAVESPMNLHICTADMFDKFTEFTTIVETVAATAAPVTDVKIGDLVLACVDDFWYRARILEVENQNAVTLDVFDVAMTVKGYKKAGVRKASAQIAEFPVLASKCVLQSWVGKDEGEAEEKFGAKIKELMEIYGQVEGEVVEVGDVTKIKIPSVEEKLNPAPGPALSRAELLKMKLKKS